jgi:signal transduction histidine kinase/CheY-like chemotaxis protein
MLAAMAVLAVVYGVAGKLGLALAFLQPSVSPVWPPAGIALAALLVLGYQTWPAIFIGAFFVNLTTAGNLITSLCIAGGNSLEALSGAWLINRYAHGVRVFDRAQDVFKFAVIAALSNAVSASVGPTSLALGGFVNWSSYGAVWLTWWLGDMTGYLIIAPAVLLWWTRPRWGENRSRTLEYLFLLLLLTGLGVFVFGNWFDEFIRNYPLSFICGPAIVWTAFRFTQRETITAIVVLAAIALWGTLSGYGPYRTHALNQSLLVLQAWAIVLTLTCMTLAAAMAEHRRAEAALEAANKTKDNFLAMLSHELRTPLTPVLALVDLLEAEDGQSAQSQTNLAVIRRNIQLESRLIDDLLDLTRIARGKLKLERKPIDAHDAVAHAVEMCRGEAEAKQLELKIDLGARVSHVMGDPAKFQQIIWNLLQNAIKFTPENGEIAISSFNDGAANLVITVRDTGIGIGSEQLGRIFHAFAQGDESSQRRYGGLGLGLAISRAIAEAHDGSLVVQSDGQNQGATFRLTMKVSESPPPLPVRDEQAREGAPQAWRILLVEDHADTATALSSLLTRRGHRVEQARDVRSALEIAGRDTFDLVISDVGLPDGTAAQLMSALRDSVSRGIAISGFGMNSDIASSLAAGFSEHLVKPLSFEKLEAAMERAMRTADQPKQNSCRAS